MVIAPVGGQWSHDRRYYSTVILKWEEEDLSGVLISIRGWTYQEPSVATAYRLPRRGSFTSHSGGSMVFPTEGHNCGMIKK